MTADELYRLIGNKTFPSATIVMMDENGIIYTPKDIVIEDDPDSTGATAFIKMEEL
jgi:hypothetical protein